MQMGIENSLVMFVRSVIDMVLNLIPVKILKKDVKRLDALKLKSHNMQEPRWSVAERALDALEKASK